MPGEAFIYDVVRTPRGKNRGGALHSVKPLDLVTGLVEALCERHPSLDPELVDDMVLGVVSPVGEQGSDIARSAALAAGLPETVPGVQLNRFCASGLEAVNIGAQKVASGFEDLVLAGGVESMSRVPLGSDGGAIAHDPTTAWDTGFVPQGIGADLIATIEQFSRQQVDEFAAESQRRAEQAWADGRYENSVVPVTDITGRMLLDTDEHRRSGTTVDALANLPPVFARIGEFGFDDVALARYPEVPRINHVHTAGNSSGIVDGAALSVIGSREAGDRLGVKPRARIVQTAVVGSDPTIMLTGPGPATRKALERAGLTASDIDLFEVNEAFASVVLRWMREMNVPHEKVNVNGGAIALGHPLGATGAMLVATLLDELERRELRRGLVTLCVGSGMGIATIIERV
ncbi:acetyl-CoA C-acetyltransferase [Paramicrobacterium chengjingii]|uniref:Acetyl-CoA C-acetyltransferase n=1 Tax=Paramicrobacterium chengjingii TaxID=2769067 RepID=A0ABX6YIQ4_9MICO|nr:acetyl-CoA C-acetyltransferase [Microbacterium chengjingii]QPZ38479.1 acetyl-CoA C-acetyltransferase [Microbacterium chengjingii]